MKDNRVYKAKVTQEILMDRSEYIEHLEQKVRTYEILRNVALQRRDKYVIKANKQIDNCNKNIEAVQKQIKELQEREK